MKGTCFIYDHDIHYGYEGGMNANFTITNSDGVTEEEIESFLKKNLNGLTEEQARKNWEQFIAEVEFDGHKEYATYLIECDMEKKTFTKTYIR